MRKKPIDAIPGRFSLVWPILAVISATICLLLLPYGVIAETDNNTKIEKSQIETNDNFSKSMILIQQNAVLSQSDHETKITEKKEEVPKRKMRVLATAYSSTVDQTDSTPFITANGTHVHDGTMAANFLKFGTRVKFPSLYGDKIFIVEDRMKSDYKVDIWFPTRQEAKNFGAKWVEIEIL